MLLTDGSICFVGLVSATSDKRSQYFNRFIGENGYDGTNVVKIESIHRISESWSQNVMTE